MLEIKGTFGLPIANTRYVNYKLKLMQFRVVL